MSFVAAHRDRFGVEPILRVLEVPVSTFCGWLAPRRHPSPRDIEQTWLGEQIQRIHAESDGPMGRPRSTPSCAAKVSASAVSGWSG
jgi:putative transposase